MLPTALILDGIPMGTTSETDVANSKVYEYRDVYIPDGFVVQRNLGVNPSFTITVFVEYAMGKI